MKKRYMPVVVVGILVVLLAAAGTATYVVRKYMPSRKQMDLTEYYGQTAEGEATLILGTEISEEKARISDGQVYLPIEVVNNYLNQRYYQDSENSQILYATPSELTSVTISEEPGGEAWQKDGITYLNTNYIKEYTDIDVYVEQNPDRVAVQYDFSGVDTVTTTKRAYIRYRGGIKADVLTRVEAGEVLILLEELENWSKVATMDGYIGYIEKKAITSPEETDFERSFERESYLYAAMVEPVNLVWHQVTTMDANAGLSSAIQDMTGVNVISPTWFSIIDNDGNISNIASSDYVALAHERGLKVWGLVDNFSTEIRTTEVLSHTASRQNLINQLITAALEVGLDGINVDFEYLSEDVGIHFLEFLRELAIECRKNKLVISVDNPVPEAFTSHYDRAEQGRVVDYVIIMGYDEHYVGSEQAGSVASLSWVEKGIQDTLAEVPAKRVINAMPFYTRLWKIENGTLTSEAIGMDTAQNTLATYNVETYWDQDAGQYYGSYEANGASYQIWLEDADSIGAKVNLATKYELAGVAAWKLGFENSGIWQVISDHLSQ